LFLFINILIILLDEKIPIYLDSRNISFIAINLFFICMSYFSGESFLKMIFYSIEKEFFPLKKPCENCIILNQKSFYYLKYESTESDRIFD